MGDSARSRPLSVPALLQLANLLLLFVPTLALSAAIDTNPITNTNTISNSKPFHVAWRENNQTRFDFVFSLDQPLRNNDRVDSIAQGVLSACVGYNACLLQDGKVLQNYHQLNKEVKGHHQFAFASLVAPKEALNSTSSSTRKLFNDTIVINNYCNTHWNPLIHNVRNGSNHTFTWHSPISCPIEATNYERACYVYDSLGELINLTPWIRSDGSSYQVELDSNNTTIKQFNLNICNDAHEPCGPNVSSCYVDHTGHVEAGFNNLTSINYNETERTATLTSLGQFNKNCPNERSKTVVKFICKDKIIKHVKPRLVKMDACENVVEWKTIYACPEADIRRRATDCTIKNDALGINIDLKQVTNNATSVMVKDIKLNNTKNSMVLGLCGGLHPNKVKCEGKSNFQTSACLLKDETKPQGANATNSNSVGLISESYIRFTDNRVYLESFAINKSCQVPSGRLNVTKQLGTRIEFYCSQQNQSAPTFLDFSDCTYNFEWGSPVLCFENFEGTIFSAPTKDVEKVAKNSTTSNPSSSPSPPSQQLNPSDGKKTHETNDEPKSAHEQHLESLEDAKKMLEPQHDAKNVDDQLEKPAKGPTSSSSTTALPPVDSKSSPASQATNVTPSSEGHKVTEIGKAEHTKMVEPQKVAPRINTFHKFFMSGLILMFLIGFIVVIFILDKKTRLRIPLGNIRRQARQVFQSNQQVPYTRVNRFNDSLDL